ncbi:hypothetical protein U0070_003344 [Myodes glareolus]|uniref:U3 small nucleolar RNA-associated protein NOL7 C-terminal domain-containing protein n=1 Tax=Myodes glareolus TaxID=447135 RepID=A0AAW0JAX1_MYOGA
MVFRVATALGNPALLPRTRFSASCGLRTNRGHGERAARTTSDCFRVKGQTAFFPLAMVQLRPRPSRVPAPAEAMVDEDQPASEEEEAEHGLLLGQPSSGAAAEPLDEDEDGDDEAPEELTFAHAQAEAREEELRVRESARRDKTLLKEKRKRREELFIEQKKRKLLPDTILQQLTTASEAELKKSPGNLIRKREANLLQKEETPRKLKYKKYSLTVNKFLSQNNKRLPVKRAAAQFLNSTWGAKKQQNAKRFKKRWMAKKMKKKSYK